MLCFNVLWVNCPKSLKIPKGKGRDWEQNKGSVKVVKKKKRLMKARGPFLLLLLAEGTKWKAIFSVKKNADMNNGD